MKKIVLCGGGTAGHVMPNLALIPELKKHFDTIAYIGTNGIEKAIVSDLKDVDFYEISAVKLIRKLTLKNLLIPYKLYKSIAEAKKILKTIKPDAIFSKGGYVSIPVVIAGKLLKIPVFSHESDITLGLANKIIYKFSNTMFTSFETTANNKPKCMFVGSPIREKILHGNKANINFSFKNGKKNVLFFGGSLGSKAINNAVLSSLSDLTKNFNVVHLCGKDKKQMPNKKYNNYLCQEYVNNIEDYFAWADIVVTRGGANALFELLALKKPMLIIPLPKTESRGDQIDNANYFKSKNYAEVLYQENLNPYNLLYYLNEVDKNSGKLIAKMEKSMTELPNKKIVDTIVKNL